jgi:hypothetical protein
LAKSSPIVVTSLIDGSNGGPFNRQSVPPLRVKGRPPHHLTGTASLGELCHPEPSSTRNAMARTDTNRLMTARCSFMASMFGSGMTIVPNRQAD